MQLAFLLNERNISTTPCSRISASWDPMKKEFGGIDELLGDIFGVEIMGGAGRLGREACRGTRPGLTPIRGGATSRRLATIPKSENAEPGARAWPAFGRQGSFQAVCI